MNSAPRTARERARAEITTEILQAARQQLTRVGPGELSLRAVAREVGMVSSAVYRYFPSRDDLLTALLISAYDELGSVAETADASVRRRDQFARRWLVSCQAIRAWAVEHRGDYALLYGSPVAGYAAPQATVPAASRVTTALVRIAVQAHAARTDAPPDVAIPRKLHRTLAGARDFAKALHDGAGDPPDELIVRTVMAWSTVFGTISFELFGHLVGAIDDHATYFDAVTERLGHDLQL